ILPSRLPILALAGLPADIRLVYLNRPGQWVAVRWGHREANAVQQEQAGLVGESGLAMDLQGRDTLLARGSAPERETPVAQGNAAILENGSRANRELLLAAAAAPTEVLLPPAVVRAASGTRPSHRNAGSPDARPNGAFP